MYKLATLLPHLTSFMIEPNAGALDERLEVGFW
jgi:hypothetical protein